MIRCSGSVFYQKTMTLFEASLDGVEPGHSFGSGK